MEGAHQLRNAEIIFLLVIRLSVRTFFENVPVFHYPGNIRIVYRILVYHRNYGVDIDWNTSRKFKEPTYQHFPVGLENPLGYIFNPCVRIKEFNQLGIKVAACHFQSEMGLYHSCPVLFMVEVVSEVFEQCHYRLVAKLKRCKYGIEIS